MERKRKKKTPAAGAAGRPRRYDTPGKLEKAIDAYFSSISRTVEIKSISGEPIRNDAGEPITTLEYLVPPSVQELSLFLGIDRRTWLNYCSQELHPEFQEITARTQLRLEAYLVRESLTREKGLQGVTFNLQNNYGWRQKQEVELGASRKTAQVQELSLAEKMAIIAQASKEYAEGDADVQEEE